jgi:hypothetical protein
LEKLCHFPHFYHSHSSLREVVALEEAGANALHSHPWLFATHIADLGVGVPFRAELRGEVFWHVAGVSIRV